MAAIEWDNVVALAPELSTVGEDAQYFLLEHVNTALVPSEFGGEESPKLRLARSYLAAHLATMQVSGGSGAAGPVLSQTAGGLSRTYADLSAMTSGSDLDATSYGQAYRLLLRTSAARAPLVL